MNFNINETADMGYSPYDILLEDDNELNTIADSIQTKKGLPPLFDLSASNVDSDRWYNFYLNCDENGVKGLWFEYGDAGEYCDTIELTEKEKAAAFEAVKEFFGGLDDYKEYINYIQESCSHFSEKAADVDQVSISVKELKSDVGFDKKNSEKKYRVKESWIFNLESMNDKLTCVLYDIQDGEISLPIEICGSKIESEEDVEALIEEAGKLELIAKSGKVTSKEYGRIEQLVNWRITQRYARCLSNGMDEKDAGECFREL